MDENTTPITPGQHHKDDKDSQSGDTRSASALNVVSRVTKKEKKKKKKKTRQSGSERLIRFIEKFFMLLCLAFIIPLASQYPIGHKAGPLEPEITSSWIVTIILFFCIGLGTKIEYLKRAGLFWQMNIFCHSIIFIYYPCIGFSMFQIAKALPDGTVSDAMFTLLEGIIILCTLPATAASAVVFTANANGNETASAINCTMSNLLGIFVTPLLMFIFMSSSTQIDALDVIYKLSLRIVLPFFVAQMIRIVIGEKGRKSLKTFKRYIKKINEISLLYMVFCALSETFYVGVEADAVDIISFLIIIVCLHCHGYVAIWFLAALFRCCLLNKSKSLFMAFTIYDRIACVYTGVSKTIAMGIPLIETIYGNDERIGMFILPILFYHPSNLIIGSILVEPFRRRAAAERNFMSSYVTATSYTNITYGTDYGAITPYKFEIDADTSFMFAPFAALPDEPEDTDTDDDDDDDDDDDNDDNNGDDNNNIDNKNKDKNKKNKNDMDNIYNIYD